MQTSKPKGVARETQRYELTGVPTLTWYDLQNAGLAPKPMPRSARLGGLRGSVPRTRWGNFPTRPPKSHIIPHIIPLCFPQADWHGPHHGGSEMAKQMVHPRPGALKEALEERGMTQWDAADRDV